MDTEIENLYREMVTAKNRAAEHSGDYWDVWSSYVDKAEKARKAFEDGVRDDGYMTLAEALDYYGSIPELQASLY